MKLYSCTNSFTNAYSSNETRFMNAYLSNEKRFLKVHSSNQTNFKLNWEALGKGNGGI